MSGNIAFVPNIPFATHNPSTDQPDMLANTNAELAIWAVDHVPFNTNFSGTHKQVTFTSENLPASAPTDPTSILYTNPGTASTVAELFYRNQNATFLLSSIKAFGIFTAITVGPTFTSQFNCASIAFSSPNFNVTLNANVCTGNNIIVFITTSGVTGTITWSFANPVLSMSGFNAGNIVSFMVLQV